MTPDDLDLLDGEQAWQRQLFHRAQMKLNLRHALFAERIGRGMHFALVHDRRPTGATA